MITPGPRRRAVEGGRGRADRFGDIARGTLQQPRDLLRAADLTDRLLAHRPPAIAGNVVARLHFGLLDPFTAHRLDRVALQLSHKTHSHGHNVGLHPRRRVALRRVGRTTALSVTPAPHTVPLSGDQ